MALNEEQEQNVETPLLTNNNVQVIVVAPWYRKRWGAVGLCTLSFLTVMVLIYVIVFVHQGAWDHVSHDPPRRINDSFVEPNTGVHFPKQIAGPQELLGVALWRYTIPLPGSPHVKVAAVGLWVNTVQARKRLDAFRSQHDRTKEQEEEMKEAIVRPGMQITMRFKMVGTPPSGDTMMKGWANDLVPYLTKYCSGGQDEVNDQKIAFQKFFKGQRFQSGFDFSFERRALDDALFVEIGELTHDTTPTKTRLLGALPCLGASIFKQKLDVFGNSLTALLDDVF